MSFSSVFNGLTKLTNFLSVIKNGTNIVGNSGCSRLLTNYAYVPKPPGKGGPMKQYKRLVKYPERYTVQKLPIQKLGGRDPYTGRVVVGTVGGGRPQKARWVDHVRTANEDGSPRVERVFAITYNPLSPARIAVVAGGDRIRYIVAHTEMKVGDLITTYADIPKNPGQVSNPEHKDQHIGSANRLRRLGYRSRSGLWHRKDGYCGRKIRPLAPLKTFKSSKEETSETVMLTLSELKMNERTKPALLEEGWSWPQK